MYGSPSCGIRCYKTFTVIGQHGSGTITIPVPVGTPGAHCFGL
jgi:hypothetical protein